MTTEEKIADLKKIVYRLDAEVCTLKMKFDILRAERGQDIFEDLMETQMREV